MTQADIIAAVASTPTGRPRDIASHFPPSKRRTLTRRMLRLVDVKMLHVEGHTRGRCYKVVNVGFD